MMVIGKHFHSLVGHSKKVGEGQQDGIEEKKSGVRKRKKKTWVSYSHWWNSFGRSMFGEKHSRVDFGFVQQIVEHCCCLHWRCVCLLLAQACSMHSRFRRVGGCARVAPPGSRLSLENDVPWPLGLVHRLNDAGGPRVCYLDNHLTLELELPRAFLRRRLRLLINLDLH